MPVVTATRSIAIALGALLLLAFLAAPGRAQGAGEGRADLCASEHAGCVAACDSLNADDAGRAGCSARCAADRAVCEADQGLEALTEQTDRIQGFLDGLLNDREPGPGAVAEPGQCAEAQEACSLSCRERFPNDEAALSGCASRCMADTALCEAQAELRAAAPKVKEEVDRWTRFLEGFMERNSDRDPGRDEEYEDFRNGPAPRPAPTPRPAPEGEIEI